LNPSDRPNLTQRCKRFATAQHLRKQLCCLGAMTRRWAPQTHYTLRRNTASIMKGLVFGFAYH